MQWPLRTRRSWEKIRKPKEVFYPAHWIPFLNLALPPRPPPACIFLFVKLGMVDDARQRIRTENEGDLVLGTWREILGNRNTRIAELNRYFNDHQLHHWASRTECLKPTSHPTPYWFGFPTWTRSCPRLLLPPPHVEPAVATQSLQSCRVFENGHWLAP